MRKLLLAALAVCAACGAHAQSPVWICDYDGQSNRCLPSGGFIYPISPGLYNTTVGTTATLLTALGTGVPTGTQYLLIAVTNGTINWTTDGVAPTQTGGMPITSGTTVSFYGSTSINALQLIGVGGNATVNVSFYK
jgi:hypothetical protein